jgi:hypothetical protein
MKRAAIATTCLLSATVPVLFAIVFYFGCCVLPFHHAMHRLMPICAVAKQMLARGGETERQTATPASDRNPNEPQLVTNTPARQALQPANAMWRLDVAAASAPGYRSFISLGAARCDADVGRQRLLLVTFRI